MKSPEHKTFSQLSKLIPYEFCKELFDLPVDLACDYIDLCYEKISNPKEDRYEYYVEVIRDLLMAVKNPYPCIRTGDALEIEAYVRAFPLFDFKGFVE